MSWSDAIAQGLGVLREWWNRKYDGASSETYALEQEAIKLDVEYREALARHDSLAASDALSRLWRVRDRLLALSNSDRRT